MKYLRITAIFVTFLVMSGECIIMNAIKKTYAESPTQDSTTAADAKLIAQADQLKEEAIAAYQSNNLEGAREKFAQALSLYRHAENKSGEAKMLINIGMVDFALEGPQKALESYEKALPLWDSQSEPLKKAETLVHIGVAYEALGELEKVIQHYTQAVPLLRAENDTIRAAHVLASIGTTYISLGDSPRVLEALNEALSLYQGLNDDANSAHMLNIIGGIHDTLGELWEALAHYQRALPLWQKLDNIEKEAATRLLIGKDLEGLGQPFEAFVHYNQALSLWQKQKASAENPDTIKMLSTKEANMLRHTGISYANLGDYQRAFDYYAQALTLWQQIGDQKGQAQTFVQVGSAHYLLGNYDKALENYQQALAHHQAVEEAVGEADALTRIGRMYYLKNENELARDFLNKAHKLWRKIDGPQSYTGEALTLRLLGLVYVQLGEVQQALDALNQAIQLNQALDQPHYKALLLSSTSGIYNLYGDFQKELDAHNQALQIYRTTGDQQGEADVLFLIGKAYESQKAFKEALEYYHQSIKISERIRTSARIEELKISLAERSGDAYQRAILLHMSLSQPVEAFNLTEGARARTFLDQLGNVRFATHKDVDFELLQQEQDLHLEITAREQILRMEHAKVGNEYSTERIDLLATELAAKQREYTDLFTRLKLTDPKSASRISVDILTLFDVQKLLDEETTLLSYFVTPNKTLAFVVTRSGFEAVEFPVSKLALREAIEAFRDFADLTVLPDPNLVQLYKWLITPLRAHLKTSRICILPHDILHYLPFAALTDGQGYFGDDYTLFTLPSASVLSFVEPKKKRGNDKLLALAYTQAEGLPFLRYASGEINALAKHENVEALIDSDATESALKARAREFELLHLSAHGQLNDVSPLFSRIVLAPDQDTDGFLEVHEIYGLDLTNTNLVVLSACGTQLGQQSRGDDIAALNRAFIDAGTSTVIASLWTVNDEATSVLMTAFYTYLLTGKHKATALQAAQKETRRRFPHPYYWATFVLTGEPGS